jgi:hypothetical protein
MGKFLLLEPFIVLFVLHETFNFILDVSFSIRFEKIIFAFYNFFIHP